jgi:hypothetical protein
MIGAMIAWSPKRIRLGSVVPGCFLTGEPPSVLCEAFAEGEAG